MNTTTAQSQCFHAWRQRACRRGATSALALALLTAAGCAPRRGTAPVKLPILMYHRIGEGGGSAWWVPADRFEAQLRSLRGQGYASVLPGDLVAYRRWGWRLPAKPVMITFDDGYRNLLTEAEPRLKALGFRAICYLPTAFIAADDASRLSLEGTPCLTWDEVRAMERRGTIMFGVHGHRHINLAVERDPAVEVRAARAAFRRGAGHTPRDFCYPFGQENPTVVEAVRRAGFRTATVCADAQAELGADTEMLLLPRVSVFGGRPVFTVSGWASVSREASACVANTGVRMPVRPRLLWRDGAAVEHSDWGEEFDASAAIVTCRWSLATMPATGAAPRVEIWDRLGVLRLDTVAAGGAP